jgi:hypothetical protein
MSSSAQRPPLNALRAFEAVNQHRNGMRKLLRKQGFAPKLLVTAKMQHATATTAVLQAQ